MKKSILNIAVTTATAITIAACSSGSDVAGIGGSGVTPVGFTSSGTITGFGSIFVNGVEFETSSSTFKVDDNPSTSEDNLAIGMRVTVTGTVNSDGITGTAVTVTYDDELQGPVSNLSTVGNDGLIKTFTVLGTTVRINSTSTNFDVTGALSGTQFGFGSVANGNNVEISGYLDSTGLLVATRVELKEVNFSPSSSIVELKGTITGLNGTSFSINGVNVDASSAAIDDLPNGLTENAFVEVKGTCSSMNCATIAATRVEGESQGFDDDSKIELEGIITEYTSDSNFMVNDTPVDASNATREPASLTLGKDLLVEVEGTIINGVLIATKVELEEGEIMIAAPVDGTPTSNSFELLPVAGQSTITVMIDTSTEIEDELSGLNSAALLGDLKPGDFLVVEGYDDGTGKVIAKNLDRENQSDDVILQGRLEQITKDDSVTVLGVNFQIQDDPVNSNNDETDFEDSSDVEISQDEFITAAPTGTLIKIKDKDNNGTNGIADEVEIELP